MFELVQKTTSGERYSEYDDKLAVVINKTGITIVGKANSILTSTGFVQVLQSDSEFAIRPCKAHDGQAFKLTHGGGKDRISGQNKWRISATRFIKQNNLTINAVYFGVMRDGMVVFSKIPTKLI